MPLTDEQLMELADDVAFADGKNGASLRDRLSSDELRAIEDFRRTRKMVEEAYANDLEEPLPAGLADMVLGHQSPTRAPSAGTVQKLHVRSWRSQASKPGARTLLAFAMAASIAAVVFGVGKWNLPASRMDIATVLAPGPIAVNSELAGVLQTSLAGDPVMLTNAAGGLADRLMVASTFRDRDNRICREFEAQDADLAPRFVAIACRSEQSGQWNLEGSASVVSRDSQPDTQFVPAGSPDADPLRALNAKLGASAPLTPDEERRLISGGWK